MTSANELFSIKGKTALVTGASSGIGCHLAKMLAANGANVVAAARRAEKLKAVVDAINARSGTDSSGGKAASVSLDVAAGEAAVNAAVDEASRHFGPIEILVNNAGVAIMAPAKGTPEDAWEKQFATNVRGVYQMSAAVASRLLKAGKGGSIINISSVLGNPGGVMPNQTAYSATKAAVQQLTKNMALELTPSGIRVNSIAPGFFTSEMTQGFIESESMKKHVEMDIPARRVGATEHDLDGPVLLLASDAGAYITGTNVTVDGGLTLALKSIF